MSAGMVVKAPCAHCPFRRDVPIYLRLDRRRNILHRTLVEGERFSCHETITVDDDDEYVPTSDERECAGLVRMAAAAGGSTQLQRIEERITGKEMRLDRGAAVWTQREFTTLPEGSFYDSSGELILPDGDELDLDEEVETCNTVNDGCLAPAGYIGTSGAIVYGTEAADGECTMCGEGVCSNCADSEGRCGYCTEEEDD